MWKYILRWFGIKEIHYVKHYFDSPTLNGFVKEFDTLSFDIVHGKEYNFVDKNKYNFFKYNYEDIIEFKIVEKKNVRNHYNAFKIETDFDIYYVF